MQVPLSQIRHSLVLIKHVSMTNSIPDLTDLTEVVLPEKYVTPNGLDNPPFTHEQASGDTNQQSRLALLP